MSVPSFKHGSEAQGLLSISQLLPSNLSRQWHL